MPTVVVIHAAEDALPARALAEKLRAAQLTPVIEQQPGDQLRAAVRDAAVTLALWSPRSVSQAALAEEVSFARSRGRLLHVRMQNAVAPGEFTGEPTHDLTGWRGEDFFPGWRGLLEEVTAMAGVQTPPAPARGNPTAAGGFFQPGAPADAPTQPPPPPPQRTPPRPAAQAPAPQPQAAPRPAPAPRPMTQDPRLDAPPPEPSSGGGKGLMIAIGLVVIAIVGGGGYFLLSNMQGSQEASSAWEDIDRNDAGELRAFIDGDPGNERDAAVRALSELEEQSFDAAQEEDTIEAFENFLNDFPDSNHAIAARGRIAELRSLPPTDEPLPVDGATLIPPEPSVDPDLLPPGAETTTTAPPAPEPDTSGGPAALTPPAPEPTPEPAPTPSPELPTN